MENKAVTATVQFTNPFAVARSENVNHGAVEIESARAIAEVQASVLVAKAKPRDEHASFERMMQSCSRMGFVSKAFYLYRRGGSDITGPTIRMAEELARNWGNIDYGFRELSKKNGETEMEAYAWDLETNVRSAQRFTVEHERHTKNGITQLTDPRDIYEIGANNGARRLRARILAILPPDYVEAAIEQCKQTLSTGGKGAKPFPDRLRDMVAAFNALGVNKGHIEKYKGKTIESFLPEDLGALVAIYNSITSNESKASEWFGENNPTVNDVNESIKKKADKKPAATTTAPASESKAAETPVNSAATEQKAATTAEDDEPII